MFKGNWKCVGCGTTISELPFEPRDTSNLMCRDCHRTKNPRRDDSQRREKRMFEGKWNCADCGGEITQLPFEPRDTSNLKCRNCFRNN
ncbi:hypothetical protein L6261_01355 [Candidatus Parcubacteria bacterium]|nr:hypothetical protein [Candidatus Parcubacteria bacterium]